MWPSRTLNVSMQVDPQTAYDFVSNGAGSEVLFTLFQTPEMSRERFAEDARLVQQDLDALKRVLEAGITGAPEVEIWMVVHPLGTSAYWVQPPTRAGDGGRWRGTIYCGRSGALDVGKRYEVMAVADPKDALVEAEVLPGWPEARWRSPVVVVTRGF